MSNKKETRGRPPQNDVAPVKFKVEDKDMIYEFDRKIHPTATIFVTEKGKRKANNPEILPKQKYNNAPVVVVWKMPRKNAKLKMKVFKNKNIDDVLTNKMAGISERAEYVEVGVGTRFINEYKEKYKL